MHTSHHIWSCHRCIMTSLTLVSLVLVAVMLSTVSGHGGVGSCCRTISKTRVHRNKLTSYYTQTRPTCPTDAVVFTTIRGRRICSDPNKPWTQTHMAYIDLKHPQIHFNHH